MFIYYVLSLNFIIYVLFIVFVIFLKYYCLIYLFF